MGRFFAALMMTALLLPAPGHKQAAHPVFFSMLFPQLFPQLVPPSMAGELLLIPLEEGVPL